MATILETLASAMATPSSVTLTPDSHLIEDFIITNDIEVDTPPTVGSTVAPYTNPVTGLSEALVIQNGGLYQVAREPLSNSGWIFLGLGADYNAIAAVDSASAWAQFRNVAGFQTGYQRISTGVWDPPLADGGDYQPLSVGCDGTVWAVDENGQLARLDTSDPSNPQWVSAPSPTGVTLAQGVVGSANKLWTVCQAGVVYRYDGTNWETVPTSSRIFQVIGGPDGSIWFLTVDKVLLTTSPGIFPVPGRRKLCFRPVPPAKVSFGSSGRRPPMLHQLSISAPMALQAPPGRW